MTKVVLNADLRNKLNGLNQPLEICDEAGHTLGQFLPQTDFERLIYNAVNAQISDEELERRLNEPGGNTLQEIWDELNCQ